MLDNQKKEVLLEILLKLSQEWDLAKGLYVLAESDFIDEKSLDGIFLIIESALNKSKDKKQIMSLNNSLKNIKKIKEMEKKDLETQNIELEKLLNEISKI